MSDRLREKVNQTLEQAKKVIFGQDNMLDAIMAALVCEGHLLIEGMPGLGKTLSVSTMSKLCDLSFKRIQFTPDLLPSDLIGTMIYSQKSEEFTTKFGPIFTQLLLADEINRSPAKVQAALLEAMAEKQVTIGDETHRLSSPFVVLATQNPIEQEGTYPLPEAQMDRFMMKLKISYPSFDAEKNILGLERNSSSQIKPNLSTDDILLIQKEIENVYVDEKIKNLIVRIVQATRPDHDSCPRDLRSLILSGASPRASIWLFRIGRYIAYMDGKDYVTPDHILKIIPDVIGHRMILTFDAISEGVHDVDLAKKIAHSQV